jgi:DNA mismatch endonuclease (patch repair protein)
MSAIKSKNTSPEILLGGAMWRLGLRYKKHYKIEGKPDFIFVTAKIAVFCDGDFWHGNNWKIRGLKSLEEELSRYSDFWVKKIRNNIERDKRINRNLRKKHWTVIRLWESDIKRSPDKCAIKVSKKIKKTLGSYQSERRVGSQRPEGMASR